MTGALCAGLVSQLANRRPYLLNKDMEYLKIKTMEGVDTRAIATFLGFAGLATIMPFYIHLQWLTGPLVNAILIIVLFLVGIRSALVLCLIPSLMALSGGLLPAVLAPVVPFIMISNTLLVLTVDWLYLNMKDNSRGYWYGVFLGSALKYAFLYFSVSYIGRLLLKQELTIKVAQMMSWPQFATALAGGAIAWVVLKWLKRI